MDQLLGLLSGGVSGAILVWLTRNWISERLKQSISYEYSEKLESYKTDLNEKIQKIQHDNQINQLRTSLFFDHQRNAFASILSKIAETNRQWFEGYDPDEGLVIPVPSKAYHELNNLCHQHQLFLDDQCLMAIDLLLASYSDSFPFDDRSGGPLINRDVDRAYAYVEYIQPRIASIFRQKIGVIADPMPLRELAMLGAMKLINNYHFIEIEIPPKGNLRISRDAQPSDIVVTAENNIKELVERLISFEQYLRKDGGFFNETQLKLRKYLAILNQ